METVSEAGVQEQQELKVLILSWINGKEHAYSSANIWSGALYISSPTMEVVNSGRGYQKNKKGPMQLRGKKKRKKRDTTKRKKTQ